MQNLIKFKDRAAQVIDYAGLLEPPIAPTDIDGCIEWKNKAYILIEVKYRDKKMSLGQKIAYERMVKDLTKAGKRTVAVVVEHQVKDPKEVIYAAQERVRIFYDVNTGTWRRPSTDCTLKEFVDDFLKWV